MKYMCASVLLLGFSAGALAQESKWTVENSKEEVVAYRTDLAGNMFGIKCGTSDSICFWAVRPLNGCGEAGDFTVTINTDGYPTPVQARCLPPADDQDPFVVFLDVDQISSVVQSSKTVSFATPGRFATGPFDVTGAGDAIRSVVKKLPKE